MIYAQTKQSNLTKFLTTSCEYSILCEYIYEMVHALLLLYNDDTNLYAYFFESDSFVLIPNLERQRQEKHPRLPQ